MLTCGCSWQQFLAFLERVQPSPTGLKIPESKRPTEYVKHYPVPTNNWPRDSDKIDGTPRESQVSCPPLIPLSALVIPCIGPPEPSEAI